MITIDPGAITLIQTTFLQHIATAFSTVTRYALNLLYLFAVLELVMFGLIWALQRDLAWSKLFFKVLKIGLIFFIIQNYSWLVNTILTSFTQLAGITLNNHEIAQFIFNPASIWQYGYNAGLHLLQLAATGGSFGLAMIQIFLGIGILLTFGLLGIQVILQVVGFYLIAFAALILLPFGTFNPSGKMFDKAVQTVLQAGVRVMVIIMVIGIAVTVWNGFQLIDLASTKVNINQPLGLFFTALLFLYMAIFLPKITARAVGSISSSFFGTGGSTSGIIEIAPITQPSAPIAMAPSGISDMQAATTIETGAAASFGTAPSSQIASATQLSPTAAAASPVVTGSSSNGFKNHGTSRDELIKASAISKSISEHTAQQIKVSLLKALKER